MPLQPTGNRILDDLTYAAFSRLRGDLTRVSLHLGEVVYREGEPIQNVYFPTDSVLSVLALVRDGGAVEVCSIGNEGVTGTQLLFDSASFEGEMTAAITGSAVAMTSAAFVGHLARSATFRHAIGEFTEDLFNSMARAIACTRYHSLEKRCARALLMTGDRVGSDCFHLTQELLGTMLGTSRPAVSVAAGALQDAGIIKYHRGDVTICDRPRLRSAACECYVPRSAYSAK